MRAPILSLILVCPAFADEVKLKDGRSFTGIVRAEGEKVTVETGAGEFTFAAADVASVEKGRTALHEYYEKDPRTARDHFELARWAEDRGISKVVKKHFQRAIEIDPEHEFARRALGYSIHKGRWMTAEEIHRDVGDVQFEGRWISREERDVLLAERESDRRVREMKTEVRERIVEVVRPVYDPYYDRPYYYYPGYFGGTTGTTSPAFFQQVPSVPTWRFRGYTYFRGR